MIETSNSDPNDQWVGFIEVGSYLCYDDINLTGVRSIELAYARNAADVSPAGRIAVLWGGSDLEIARNLGERLTRDTAGWTNFQPLSVGLAEDVSGVNTLCFRGLQGNGIMNFDEFTLSADSAENDGITDINLDPPSGPLVPAITVEGSQVLFGGQATSVAGNSFFWSNGRFSADIWYNENIVNWLVEDWNTQIVRAAMAVDDNKPSQDAVPVAELGGYLTHPFENKLNVQRVVNAAIENEIYVIIDWHAHKAEDHTEEAIQFFQDMARTYGQYNNIIYEIYNEPVNTDWPTIKAYATQVIDAIRAIDPDNLIIVGTPFYSSRVEDAASDPIEGNNIAYALHFYAGEQAHNQYREAALRAMDSGIALFVTEWGTSAASGNGGFNAAETRNWMDFLKENNISHVNWSVSAIGNTPDIIQRGASVDGGWDDQSDLTESGRLLKDIISNW